MSRQKAFSNRLAFASAVAAMAMLAAAGLGAAKADDCANNSNNSNINNDYPTEARADYVFACMESNGKTRLVLSRCSCSIDIIASILPYDKYVEAETIISVGMAGGENTSMMRSDPGLREKVAELRRAQAEADVRCF